METLYSCQQKTILKLQIRKKNKKSAILNNQLGHVINFFDWFLVKSTVQAFSYLMVYNMYIEHVSIKKNLIFCKQW